MIRAAGLIVLSLILGLATACAPKQSGGETNSPPTEVADEEVQEDEGGAPTIDDMRAEALAAIDVDACEAGGGEVRPEGMLGMPRCVTPYADAGKVCRGSDDCAGRCLGDDATTDYNAPPGEMKGLCEADDSPFGCYAEIENGAADGMICVD